MFFVVVVVVCLFWGFFGGSPGALAPLPLPLDFEKVLPSLFLRILQMPYRVLFLFFFL